ncbi:hypothetical protein ACFVYG_32705 [Streptomyces sp. NPDC058256]|uniref:hypothetical protein n=1 Tax=Streptomyces sp. NPDC058256 TaxID=3346408 RepID=UPI0036E7C9D7
MSGHTETNVRLPPCAFEALATVVAREGTSRDATVRRLLAEHVERQEQEYPEDRLTHISTVLRYPPPPRWRGDPRTDLPLRLRLPAGLLERARAVSLRLPGQYQRAFRDYQGRMVTDAVMTAIARSEPFEDEVLEGLLPLLHHRAARNLWRLAAAALCTRPELLLLDAAERLRSKSAWTSGALDEADRHLLLVVEALEEDAAWHSPARFRVAANIARDLLTGPEAAAKERVLHEDGEAWHLLHQDTLRADEEHRSWLLRGTTTYDFTGRGGTAVWRAERQVGLQYFEDWLLGRTGDDTAGYVTEPPGWMLTRPSGWNALAPSLTSAGRLPQPYAQWAAEGRALVFPHSNRQALWPLRHCSGPPGWEPVPGAEPLLAAARGLRPEQIPGFIEAVLIDWNHEFDEDDEAPDLRLALDLPVSRVYDFGLITAEERQRAMAQAREATLQEMDDIIAALKDDDHGEDDLRELQEVRGSAREFTRVAKRIDKRVGSAFRVGKAVWQWPGLSAAGELLAGSPADLVQWLADAAHDRSTLILGESMQQAWGYAFDRYGRRDRRGKGRV